MNPTIKPLPSAGAFAFSELRMRALTWVGVPEPNGAKRCPTPAVSLRGARISAR